MKEIDWLAGGSDRKRIKAAKIGLVRQIVKRAVKLCQIADLLGFSPLLACVALNKKYPLPKNNQFITPTYPQRNWDKFHADFRLPQLIYPFHQNQRIRIHLDDQDCQAGLK